MQDLEARIRNAVDKIQHRDRQLAEEMNSVRGSAGREQEARVLAGRLEARVLTDRLEARAAGGLERAVARPDFALETIVLRVGRPVLAILRDEPRLEFRDAESEVWRDRLTGARDHLRRAIQATGRIEVENHPSFEWVGTGYVVSEDVIVTNRHVANLFARRNGAGFVFRQGRGGRTMAASIDFLEEFDRTESLDFRLRRILHVEDERGPDIALLQVEPMRGRRLATPIPLARRATTRDRMVAVIGYPARDSRLPDQDLMEEIFGNVYDKKRLAPGQITEVRDDEIEHDCSTLGGNSGSVVLDLRSGEALGLHFAGIFLEANFAVPASLVADRLRRLGRIGSGVRRPLRERDSDQGEVRLQPQVNATVSGDTLSYTIPIRVTVDVGTPVAEGYRGRGRGPTPPAAEEDDEEILPITEARPEDYADRAGYDPRFLGSGVEVPLPKVGSRRRSDILTFELDGRAESELKYQHFSVVMSRSRRLCFMSAVNIDGQQPRNKRRVGWRLDPRIPEEAQIIRECYGNPPRFSRGHMTRRQDPIWGSSDDAALGNADSMHATNAVPQVQLFNAGIWLGLEDYALENAREDDMRISVFTGPFLRDDDPESFGVQIPVSFWKVIAFIHDESGDLSATGYLMSQESFLTDEEHVFGQHEMSQVPIATIEQQAGLSFGDLASRDPLREMEEARPTPLTSFRQIRFV